MDTDATDFLFVNVRVIDHFAVVIKIDSDSIVKGLNCCFGRCGSPLGIQIKKLDFVAFRKDDVVLNKYAGFAITGKFARRTEAFTSVCCSMIEEKKKIFRS